MTGPSELTKEGKLTSNAAIDAEMQTRIGPASLILGVLFALVAVTNLLVLPPAVSTPLVLAAGAVSLLLLAFRLFWMRHPGRISWTQEAGGGIAGLILLYVLLHIYISQQPGTTIYLALLILGAGYWLLSGIWLSAISVTALIGWGIIVRFSAPSSDWLSLGIGLILAIACAAAIHVWQVQAQIKLKKEQDELRQRLENELGDLRSQFEQLKADEARHKAELETVLTSTEEAQRNLATGMAVGQRVTSILDLDILLSQVVDLIKERYRGAYVGIYLLDESGEYVVLRAVTGDSGRRLVKEGHRRKVGEEGITGWVAAKRRPLCVDDVRQDPRYLVLDGIPNTRSEVALPLEAGQNLLGVLNIESEQVGAYHEDDVPYLQMLADQVAIAIRNASLYKVEKARRLLAETLYGVGRALSSTLDLEEVLDIILKQLAEIVEYDRVAIMMRIDGQLEIAASRGFPATSQKMRVSIKEGDVFQEIYRTRQPLHLPDVSKRADWTHASDLPPARAWLGIPLIRSDEVIGMLSITRETLTPFSSDEITLSSTFAGQAAIAIQNARLYDEITRFNQDLEDRVAQRTEALQAAYDQLERLDHTKSDFISIASHELRTPLTVIQGYSQMLLEDPAIKKNDFQKQLVQGIMGGQLRLGEIVNSLLDAAKIDSRAMELNPSPVLVSSVVEFVCSQMSEAFSSRSMRLELDESIRSLPAIRADVEGMRKVFSNLITNALKYTPDGGEINISGQYLSGTAGPEMEGPVPGLLEEGAVEVVVSDTGIGVAPEVQQLIFQKFYQSGTVALHSSGRVKFKGGGPGLGLAIVKGIVEAHGGRVWVESAGHDEVNCPGSKFHVVLPIKQ